MERLTVSWGPQPVLDAVNLQLHAGERLVVVGPSGAGKSTVLRLLAGLLLPSEGMLRIHGEEQTYLRLDQRHPPDVRLVFQNPALLASLTVRENVGFLLYRFSRLREGEIRERVSRALEAGQLIALLPDSTTPTVPMSVVYPQTSHLSAKVRAFADFVATMFPLPAPPPRPPARLPARPDRDGRLVPR